MLYNLIKVKIVDNKRVKLLSGVAIRMVRDSLTAGRSITVQIDSTSMVPWVVPGEKVVFRSPDIRLLPGTVVIALGPRGPLTHRVVAVESGRYLLKGDGFPRFDGWFSANRILAYATAVKRRKGELKTDTFINRTRAFMAALLSRFQGYIWPGSPLEGVKSLPGRALFFVYKLSLVLLFPRFKL
jgi:hypothetical protein